MSCVEVWQGSMVRVGTMGRYYVQDEKNNFGFFCECSSFYGTNTPPYTYGLGMMGTTSGSERDHGTDTQPNETHSHSHTR